MKVNSDLNIAYGMLTCAGLGQEEEIYGHSEEVLERLAITLPVSMRPRLNTAILNCCRYYPGSDQRYKTYLERYPQAEAIISPKGEGETIPWTV